MTEVFEFEEEATIEATFQIGITAEDHGALYNRDAPNQHPISAITNLQSTLDGISGVEGNLENLMTDDKNNLVSAINEVDSHTDTNAGNLANHINDKSNPHVVTKAQVGLGNVDNTSDLDKPISTATQNALNLKVNTADLGNAELDIQKNGTSVGKFTANASVDKVINLVIPTQASDVNALPDSTKYGASLSLTINSSTFVVTAQLKDQDGNNLGSAQTIDLPLESVVVNGSYDSVNKKIILTLENGNTIDIPVDDLVAGLQSEITVDNKLASDLVDDSGQTNKFVTASEKSQITTNANDISNLQSGKQDNLTTAQLNAVNSGITSAKVTQYDGYSTSKANVGLDNLNADGQMIIDSQNGTISNCILKIPQNLKCEISGTTYTLKAGSIRTVFGSTYTTITTGSDITVTLNVSTDGRFVMIGSTNAQAQIAIEKFDSGATTPSSKTTDYFWNTTDKLMYIWRTANSEYQAFTTWCYPSCLIDISGGVASFAKDSKGHDLIFNGCGYIGHHWFVFPDVTGLIPYNFDDDKKLKSIKYTTTSLVVGEMQTYPYSNYYNRGLFLYPTDGVTTSGWSGPINSLSDDPNVGYLGIYVKDDNRWHRRRGSGTSFGSWNVCLLVDYKYDGTTVNDFVIYQPYEDARDLLTDEIKEEIATKANDSDVAKLTGDQNIAGSKIFLSGINVLGTSSAPYSLQRTGITKGTAPSSTVVSRWRMTESGGVTNSYSLGGMTVTYNSNGSISTSLQAFKPEASSTVYVDIGVVYPASGDPYTFAPTPTEDTTSSTQIDTVGARNTKLADYQTALANAIGYDATQTQTLKNINGVLTWVTD